MTTVDTSAGTEDSRTIDLAVGGMTCASCARRVEKALNKLPGVTASVNYATEKARVSYTPSVAPDDLVAAVTATGYTATLPPSPKPPAEAGSAADDPSAAEHDPAAALRTRLIISALLTLPVLVLTMVPPAQFDYWQWAGLTLAAPVTVWGALPFHRAAWTNLRHGVATMDTLISVGVLAAFGWSLYALFLGGAGEPGMTMGFNLVPERGGGADEIYLEVASAVTVFILAGRYFEARAKRRSGAALRALMDLGAKDVAVLHDGI
jgi:Cu+-exporting ATPase